MLIGCVREWRKRKKQLLVRKGEIKIKIKELVTVKDKSRSETVISNPRALHDQWWQCSV